MHLDKKISLDTSDYCFNILSDKKDSLNNSTIRVLKEYVANQFVKPV